MTDLHLGEATEFWGTVPKWKYNQGLVTNIGGRLKEFREAHVEPSPEQVMAIDVPEVLALPICLIPAATEQIPE